MLYIYGNNSTAMGRIHEYNVGVEWTGNSGSGTSDAGAYARSHTITSEGKEPMYCSSDPAFRGDRTKYNPEEFLLAALSSCHMLWYLHLCADAGIVVTAYVDSPRGTMKEETPGDKGRFTEVVLCPKITLADISQEGAALELHEKAHHKCFIANSCNFPVLHEPVFLAVQ